MCGAQSTNSYSNLKSVERCVVNFLDHQHHETRHARREGEDRRMELGHMQTPAVIICTSDPPNVDPNLTIVHHANNPLSKPRYKPKISQFNTVLKVVAIRFSQILEIFFFLYF